MGINPLAFSQQGRVHPLVALLQGILGAKLYKEQRGREQEQEDYAKQLREAQLREVRQQPLQQRWNFYLQQYAQDPRGAFRAAYEDSEEFRSLAQQLYNFMAPPGEAVAPPQGAFGESTASGPGVGLAQLGSPQAQQTYRLPGPPPPAFRTLGELAQKFGLKLRPGVDPTIEVSQLPRDFDLSKVMLDPEVEKEQERQAARARLEQVTKIYPLAQILSTPALRDPFMRDYQVVFGRPFPTQQVPEMRTVQPPVAGTGPGLALIGTQQPIGPLTEQPIIPQAPAPETVTLFNISTGQMQTIQLPPGGRLQTYAPPGQPPQHVIVMPNGEIRPLPPGWVPHFAPRPGGGGSATETQARMKSDLMRRYLAGETLNAREQRVLFGTAGEETLSAKDREILRLWRDNLDPMTGDPKDKALAGRLKPHVDRITNQLMGGASPAPAPPPGAQPPSAQQVFAAVEAAAREGASWPEVQAFLQQRGVTDGKLLAQARRRYEAARKGSQAPPEPQKKPASEAEVNRLVEETARKGYRFPEVALRNMGLNDQQIAILRARYDAIRKATAR